MESKWILTKDELPEKGVWVLTTINDHQKPIEIRCYLGIRRGSKASRKTNYEWVEYEYPAWTSGHGDISSRHPIAWTPLPSIPEDIWKEVING